MDYKEINDRIDQFFDSVTPAEVVAMFEDMGYEFEANPDHEPPSATTSVRPIAEVDRACGLSKQLSSLLFAGRNSAQPTVTVADTRHFESEQPEQIDLATDFNFGEADTRDNYAIAA